MVFLIAILSLSAHAANLREAFTQGKYETQLRAYNNTLVFQHGADKYGSAFGGRLAYETNAEKLGGFSLGMAYYTANDLDTNHEDTAARAPFTPTVDVDIMGEAYAKYSRFDTVFIAGRQLYTSPHANPSDAFLIPVTFTGYSLINKSVKGLTIQAAQLLSIKSRESTKFVNVGEFTLNRYARPVKTTDGTLVFGLTYDWEKLKVQGWHYTFPDLFTMEWLDAEHKFEMNGYAPYVGAHYASEKEQGGELLGKIDSKLIGARVGVKAHGGDLSFGYDSISKDRFLSPYTFFTDGMYTNSMITGMSNIGSGIAWKLMASYDITPRLWTKLSYSKLNYNNDSDTSEADFDVRFKCGGDLEGLQVLVRTGYRNGGTQPAALPDLLEYRTQLQYVF